MDFVYQSREGKLLLLVSELSAFNLKEAWVRYLMSGAFNLKLGLQIPIFNHFNEIKNKMPTRSTKCS